MAIEKYNLYMPAQNLTNLSLNVDINRIGIDKINIDVNYGTSPATVSIKDGSIIEVNGNLYIINGSDYTFQMANATHNYITFTDNPAVAFGSAASEGTYRNDKMAYYQADNVTRTLGWFIDQTISEHFIYLIRQTQVINPDMMLDRVTVELSGNSGVPINPVQFNTIIQDRLGNFDVVNYKFVCKYSGNYILVFNAHTFRGAAYFASIITIYVNGVSVGSAQYDAIYPDGYITCTSYYPLNVGDEVTFGVTTYSPAVLILQVGTNASIMRTF